MRSLGILTALLLLMPFTARAAERTSTTLEVSAVVVSNCRLTANPLMFGNYDPLGANSNAALEANTQLFVTCTRDTHVTILLDAGRNAAAGEETRALLFNGQLLGYQLFRDPARTQPWTRKEGLEYVSRGPGNDQGLTVYASIAPGQGVVAGVYTDVVTATVEF